LKKEKQHYKINMMMLIKKISQGRNALGNLEATLMGLKGAISQIDWVLGLFVDETNKKDK
jgi:CII-binding regulator of phage lambda lysogenization HflD